MLMMEARQELVDYGKKMFEDGLVTMTSGNISIFDPRTGYMAITPSGIPYFETAPEDIVIMTLDGKIVEGTRKPSSEHDLHASVYKVRPEARAAVHTHSKYATVLSILGEEVKAVHFTFANVLDRASIPVAPYHTYGTPELAESVKEALKDSPACLMANHGMVASGRSLEDAYLAASVIESTAELQYLAQCVGTPSVLSGKEVHDTYENFTKHYGQK